MPRVDFRNVNDVADFSPIPDGEYLCRIAEIETDLTKSGDDMWKLRWTVEGGEHDGRIVFDNLIFSPRAMSKVKLVCLSCGVDVSGVVDLEPPMLVDRRALVTTYQEKYKDDKGLEKITNQIPFEGYKPVPEAMTNLPF